MDQSFACFFPLAPEHYVPWPQEHPYTNGQAEHAPILQPSPAIGNPLEREHSWGLSIVQRRPSEPASEALQRRDLQFVMFDGKCFVGPTRSPLTEQGRNKIRRVREKGACLRCRIRKIPCDEKDPCDRCQAMKSSSMCKALLWMPCIRGLNELNIFCADSRIPSSESSIKPIAEFFLQNDRRASDSEESFKWTLAESSENLASWLTRACPPIIGFMGVLDVRQFQDMIEPYINPGTRMALKAFLTSSFFVRAQAHFFHCPEEVNTVVHSIRDIAGKEIVAWLEKAMGSLRIDVRSPEEKGKWQAIFHVLVGATLAICLASDKRSDDARTRLVGLLCHITLFVAKRLGIVDPKCDRLNLSDSVEEALDKVELSIEPHLGQKQTYLFTDKPDLSPSPVGREPRNCSTYDQPRPHTDVCCMHCNFQRLLASKARVQANRVRKHREMIDSDVLREIVVGGEVGKCVSSSTKPQVKRSRKHDEAREPETPQKLVVDGDMDKCASLNPKPQAKRVRDRDDTPVSEMCQDFVFEGDMDKCRSCHQLWPGVDATGLCNDCRRPK